MAFSQGVANKVKTEREAKHIRVNKKSKIEELQKAQELRKKKLEVAKLETGQHHCLTITVW